MDTIQVVIRLLGAMILGGIIGIERERHNMPAGLRTHMLVCVGASLVMLTSQFIFDVLDYASSDPARLGAQVISGIGFLGAGTIIRQKGSVKGLTTAASLWGVGCIGLAVGIGFYEGALIAFLILFLALMFLRSIEDKYFKRYYDIKVQFESDKLSFSIGEKLASLNMKLMDIKEIEKLEGKTSMVLTVKGRNIDLLEVKDDFFDIIKIEKSIK